MISPSPEPPAPDASLRFAHYEVRRRPDGSPWQLGEGGMGVTYKAADTRLRIDVALKVIRPAAAGREEAQRHFVREARAAARVHHPNVAPVVFLSHEPGECFYAMEFVDGVSLDVFLRARPPLPPRLALAFLEQVARGLEAIHEQKLVHRDLKPGNVMVVEFPPSHPRHRPLAGAGGRLLKIIDFGLARGMASAAASVAPVTAGFRGTAAYASPEQCLEASDLDARSDLYALGCILWEMLSGRPPFVARSEFELFQQHLSAALLWDTLPADVPGPVRTLLARLLAKDRNQRPADAGEVLENLREARAACPAPTPGPIPASAETTGETVPPAAFGPALAAVAVGDPPSGDQMAPGPGPSLLSPPIGTSPPGNLDQSAIPQPEPGAAKPRGSTGQFALPPATVTLTGRSLGWALGVAAVVLAGAFFVAQRWTSAPVAAGEPPAVPPPAVAAEASAAEPRVLAVLPFEALGSGGGAGAPRRPEDEAGYFADGIHEDLLTSLAKVEGLRLVARSSVMRFRDRRLPAREAAQALGATLVLEGSVRRAGPRVRVTANLVDAATAQQLWAETYDREVRDVFEIQSVVAREIAAALRMNLSAASRAALVRRPTTNAEAYEKFLQARSIQQRTDARQAEVIALYERAVELDPTFALAWARLSREHARAYWYAYDHTPERVAKARRAAEAAVRLQPELAEARVALGDLHYRIEYEWEAALREYRVALAIEPDNVAAVGATALALRRLGRWEESLAQFRRAIELAPDDGQKVNWLAETLLILRRYPEADESFAHALLLFDNPTWAAAQAYTRLELSGNFAAYEKAVRALAPRVPPDERPALWLSVRDFPAAEAALRELPDTLTDAQVTFPKTLVLGDVLAGAGRAAEARAAYAAAARDLEPAVARTPSHSLLRMKLARALAGRAEAGDRTRAGREAAEAARAFPESHDHVFGPLLLVEQAQVLAACGESEAACDVLEHLMNTEVRLTRTQLRHGPEWTVLRGNARFEKLLGN